MCRPHFHSPLHPWDSKPLVPHAHSTAWMTSPFSSKGALSHPSSSPLGHSAGLAGSSGSSTSSANHLFNFPPTPPKDSTPDMSGSGANGANGAHGGVSAGGSSHDYSPTGDHSKSPASIKAETHGHSSAGAGSSLGSGSDSAALNHSYSSAGLGYSPSSLSYSNSALSSYSTSLSSMSGLSSPGTAHPMPTYPYMTGPADYGSSLFHPANMLKAATLARARTKTRSSSGEGENIFTTINILIVH